MLGVLFWTVLAQEQIHHGQVLPEPSGTPRRLMISVPEEKLDPPKVSPKHVPCFRCRTSLTSC